jgi:hypothetical protein
MRWIKLTLGLLIILQLPFVYEVCRSHQLIQYLDRVPREEVADVPFVDLRGTIHVHSAAGSHSLGTYPEIIEAAKMAGYDFVFLTEHPRENSIYRPVYDRDVILIYGWEEVRPDGDRQLRSDDFQVVVFSEYDGGPIPEDVTGVELFNMAVSAKQHNNLVGWLTWIYHKTTGYEELFPVHVWEIEEENFRGWDKACQRQKLCGVIGNNAHQNLGLLLRTASGQRLLTILVDPYSVSFTFMSNHVMIPRNTEVGEEAVLAGLRNGSAYMAFEGLGDSTGFSFHAVSSGQILPMGSEADVGAELVFQAPRPSRFRLVRSGTVYRELEGSSFRLLTTDPGTYRVEVRLLNPPPLLRDKPWILSNPIYIR